VASVNTEGPPTVRITVQCLNDALLFRTIATLRLDVPVFDSIQDLRWTGSRTVITFVGLLAFHTIIS
jgi:hypothetical protein